jgi:hypothetical protein
MHASRSGFVAAPPSCPGRVAAGRVVVDRKTIQIHVRRLKFLTDDKILPDSQLWGFIDGPLG